MSDNEVVPVQPAAVVANQEGGAGGNAEQNVNILLCILRHFIHSFSNFNYSHLSSRWPLESSCST